MKSILITIFILSLVQPSFNLSASQVSNVCHCDLTSSYCDFGCCCDKDCSSTISNECFLTKSSLFCLNSSYYYKIDTTLPANSALPNCYYYNESSTLQEEVTISAREIADTAAGFARVAPLANDDILMDRGYVLGNSLSFSGVSLFSFTDPNGNCLASGSNSQRYEIGWRMNADFTCLGTSNSINLFNNIIGKTLNAFSSSTDRTVTVPLPDGDYNEAVVYIFIGTMGSSNIEFIQTIRTTGTMNGNPGTRTLRIRFVNPLVDLEQEQASPSFFPQIPKDIFYPLYQIAYSF